MILREEREDYMKNKNCPSIVPFMNVVDFYLRNEPVRGFPPTWREFRRAALESMEILRNMLGQARPTPGPECIDLPKYSMRANVSLEHKVPVARLRREGKKQ
jgi:hypothetical protein